MCKQCKGGFFITDGICKEKCPSGTESDSNGVCRQQCKVVNCDTCDSKGECLKCNRGFFKIGKDCVEECPIDKVADRVTWSCLDKGVLAWYWVQPTTSSCKDKCDGVPSPNNGDCLCTKDCVRKGNCCQDFKLYCKDLAPSVVERLGKVKEKTQKVENNKKEASKKRRSTKK